MPIQKIDATLGPVNWSVVYCLLFTILDPYNDQVDNSEIMRVVFPARVMAMTEIIHCLLQLENFAHESWDNSCVT